MTNWKKEKAFTLILCVFPIGQFIQGEYRVILATPGNLWTQKMRLNKNQETPGRR